MKTLAAAAVAVAFAASGSAAQALPACSPTATSYDTGGAPLAGVPNDPLFTHQWGLTQIKAPDAWAKGALGNGVTIAIVDSGVDLNHPDLKSKIVPGIDLVSGETCTPGDQDLNGHGTHVAGIAAAITNNGIGVAGTAPGASIMPVRVLDSSGSGSTADVASGIRWAADHGAQVINLSLGDASGLPLDTSGISSAVSYAYSKGAVIVAAAGNDTFPFCDYPSASADAICVAANDSGGFPSSYSNFPVRSDGGVAVRAPGGDNSGCGDGDIWSTYWPAATAPDPDTCGPRGYEPLAGTSMATPFVSGIAALLTGAGLSNAQIMDCIKRTSSNGGIYDPINGYGRVNAAAAVTGCTQLPLGATPMPPGGSTGKGTTGQPGGQTGGGTTGGQGGVLGDHSSSDTTAPHVRVAFARSPKAHAARAGFVLIRVRLSEGARVALKVMSGRETAVAGRNALVLAKGAFKLSSGAATVKVRLTRLGMRTLHSRRLLTATVLAVASDAAGNDGTAIAEGKIRR